MLVKWSARKYTPRNSMITLDCIFNPHNLGTTTVEAVWYNYS
jgi:hypothetical protein